ncbi:MAG: isoprenyl transferase [Proteobacteria bacterium]|nr:isoprenyl transferase [Pseudomonadota bacterium]MBU1687755.1 isoprenyl transferase [Pseudomonadota bacterium]
MNNTAAPDPDNIPTHIAIIMDGNGRWAKKRGLPRVMGHRRGVESVQAIVRSARELGVKVLTLYAFSTENWNRPPIEVQALMGLLKNFLKSELADLVENDVSLRAIGQRERLPQEVRESLEEVEHRTRNNGGLILNLALSYGGRAELVRAVRTIISECQAGSLSPEQVSEETIANHLYTAGQPDPDLMIRTGGESRLSNFLLWQLSYAEIHITETLWPDFRHNEFLAALMDYQKRQRRFGRVVESGSA